MKELKFTPIYHGMTRGELETEIRNAKAQNYIDEFNQKRVVIDWDSDSSFNWALAGAFLFLLATVLI